MSKKLALLAAVAVCLSSNLSVAGQSPKPNRVVLKTVSDSRDPFSPAAGTSTITGRFDVKPTGTNVQTKQNEITHLLRMSVVVRNAAGQIVRNLVAEQPVEAAQGQPAGHMVPVSLAVSWNGRTAAGQLVADGTYTYEVDRSLSAHAQERESQRQGPRKGG